MMRCRGLLFVAVVAGVLAGCWRETRTVVHPPRQPQEVAQAQAPVEAPVEPPAAAAPPSASELGAAPAPAAAPGFQGNRGDTDGARLLAARSLMVPVLGVPPEALFDTYEQSRGGRTHEAIDIAAAAGTPVVAVDDGRIAKLFHSKPGGLTVYQFDREGRLAYYYAHLERYSDALHEGQEVRRGTVLGFVGSTGNADPKVPHLHFAVFKLGPDRKWWEGDPVNPYPALRNGTTAQVAVR